MFIEIAGRIEAPAWRKPMLFSVLKEMRKRIDLITHHIWMRQAVPLDIEQAGSED